MPCEDALIGGINYQIVREGSECGFPEDRNARFAAAFQWSYSLRSGAVIVCCECSARRAGAALVQRCARESATLPFFAVTVHSAALSELPGMARLPVPTRMV